MVKKYYLHNGKEQQGPFSIEDLKAKNITKETSIWYEGLSDWTVADNVYELKDLLIKTTPPPFGSKTTIPPLTPPSIHQSPILPKPAPKKKNTLGKILQSIGIIGAVLIAVIIIGDIIKTSSGNSNNSPQTYQEKVMTIAEIEQSQPSQFLTADGNYNQNFLGTKLKVHGLIRNTATVASYKDAVVQVTYYSKTKTILGSEKYTIYETFAPHSTVNFELKIENYQDVSTIGWDVIDAVGIGK
jgi:hypothetical protein